MDKPLVSIIIPVYNVKKHIKRCIKSVENQTYKNLEIILVDDGSTDGSGDLCKELLKQDDRIIMVSQSNKGLSAARNAGIDICHGDFITFVDSDDVIEKDYVEYLLGLLLENKSDFSICAHKEIKNNKTFHDCGKGLSEKQYTPEECLKDMLNERGFTVSAWGKLYSKKLFKNIRFPEGKLHEDLSTTYKLILQSKKITYGQEPKYLYYQNKTSITNSGFNEQKLSIIDQTDEMCKEILQQYPKLVDTTIARRVHARFSVLRLMVSEKNLSEDMQKEKKIIKTFLKNHKKYILNSPNAPKRTKIAMRTLSLGEPVFKLSWKVYSKFLK